MPKAVDLKVSFIQLKKMDDSKKEEYILQAEIKINLNEAEFGKQLIGNQEKIEYNLVIQEAKQGEKIASDFKNIKMIQKRFIDVIYSIFINKGQIGIFKEPFYIKMGQVMK